MMGKVGPVAPCAPCAPLPPSLLVLIGPILIDGHGHAFVPDFEYLPKRGVVIKCVNIIISN
jgi:hypothetical protein